MQPGGRGGWSVGQIFFWVVFYWVFWFKRNLPCDHPLGMKRHLHQLLPSFVCVCVWYFFLDWGVFTESVKWSWSKKKRYEKWWMKVRGCQSESCSPMCKSRERVVEVRECSVEDAFGLATLATTYLRCTLGRTKLRHIQAPWPLYYQFIRGKIHLLNIYSIDQWLIEGQYKALLFWLSTRISENLDWWLPLLPTSINIKPSPINVEERDRRH